MSNNIGTAQSTTHLSAGVIAGIVGGILGVALVICAFIIIFLIRRQRIRSNGEPGVASDPPEQMEAKDSDLISGRLRYPRNDIATVGGRLGADSD